MGLATHSRFYYGHAIDSENYTLDFSEGGAEIQATLEVGEYTLTDFLDAVAAAMNAVGGQTYTVSVDRDTRLITISAAGNFELLPTTGTRIGSGVWSLLGFTGADQTGANSYTGDTASGSEYRTQFIIQDHIAKEDWTGAVDATVNKSASGKIEVVSFGSESFVQANFKYLTDQANVATDLIRTNVSGLAAFRAFANYLITKAPVEFMPDEDDTATFDSLILESTPDDEKGVRFKLKELYSQNLFGFFESGPFKFRVVD